jgi:murein DD-endopeptidase MepM/ murein hydrolase activator NlpD
LHPHPHRRRAPLAALVSVLLVIAASAGSAEAGSRHVFPIDGPHSYGSPYGADRGDHTHGGQDLPAAEGTPLRAVADGRVAHRRYQAEGAGHYLVIEGADGRDSVYMHMQSTGYVAPGTYVRAGQVIGRVGDTGNSFGAHLHFELWTPHWYAGGHNYDPVSLLRRWDRPPRPKKLTARAGAGSIRLDWAPVREGDLAGYRVYRRTARGNYEYIGSTRPSEYLDRSARPGRTYYYQVKAVDRLGYVSRYSEAAQAEIAAAAG